MKRPSRSNTHLDAVQKKRAGQTGPAHVMFWLYSGVLRLIDIQACCA